MIQSQTSDTDLKKRMRTEISQEITGVYLNLFTIGCIHLLHKQFEQLSNIALLVAGSVYWCLCDECAMCEF